MWCRVSGAYAARHARHGRCIAHHSAAQTEAGRVSLPWRVLPLYGHSERCQRHATIEEVRLSPAAARRQVVGIGSGRLQER